MEQGLMPQRQGAADLESSPGDALTGRSLGGDSMRMSVISGPSAAEAGMEEEVVEIAAGLTSFPPGFVSSASFIRTCKLNFNKIDTTAFQELEGLRYQKLKSLHLSHNRLKGTLPDGLDSALPVLEHLDVSHNALANVDAVKGLRALTTLHLHYNSIVDLAGLADALKELDLLRTLTLHENTGIRLANQALGQAAVDKAKRETGSIITAGASSGLPPRLAASGKAFSSGLSHDGASASTSAVPAGSAKDGGASAAASASAGAAAPLLEQIAMLFAARCGNLRQLVLVSPLHALRHGLGKIGEKLLAGGGHAGGTIADNGMGSCAEVTSSHIGLCLTQVTSSFAQAAQQWAASPAGVNMERRLREVARRHEEEKAEAIVAAGVNESASGSGSASPSRLSRASPSPSGRKRGLPPKRAGPGGKPKYEPGAYRQRPPSERSKRLWQQGSPPRIQLNKGSRVAQQAQQPRWGSTSSSNWGQQRNTRGGDGGRGRSGAGGRRWRGGGSNDQAAGDEGGSGDDRLDYDGGDDADGDGDEEDAGENSAGYFEGDEESYRNCSQQQQQQQRQQQQQQRTTTSNTDRFSGVATSEGEATRSAAPTTAEATRTEGGATQSRTQTTPQATVTDGKSSNDTSRGDAEETNATKTEAGQTSSSAVPTTTMTTTKQKKSASKKAAQHAPDRERGQDDADQGSVDDGEGGGDNEDGRESDNNSGDGDDGEDEEADDGADGSASHVTAGSAVTSGSGSASRSAATADSNVSITAKAKAANFLSFLQKKTSNKSNPNSPGRPPASASAVAAGADATTPRRDRDDDKDKADRERTFGTVTLAAADEVTVAGAAGAIGPADTEGGEMVVTSVDAVPSSAPSSASGSASASASASASSSPSKAEAPPMTDKEREAKEALTRAKTLTFLSRLQKGVSKNSTQGSNKLGASTPTSGTARTETKGDSAAEASADGDTGRSADKPTEKPVLASDGESGGPKGDTAKAAAGTAAAAGSKVQPLKSPLPTNTKAPLVSIRPFPVEAQITPSVSKAGAGALLSSPLLYRNYVPRSSPIGSPSGGAFRRKAKEGGAAAASAANDLLDPEAAAAAIGTVVSAPASSDDAANGNGYEDVSASGYRVTFSGRVFAGAEGKDGAEAVNEAEQAGVGDGKTGALVSLAAKRDAKVALRVFPDGTASCVWPPPLPSAAEAEKHKGSKEPFGQAPLPVALRVRKTGATGAGTPTASADATFLVEAFAFERRFRDELFPSRPVLSLSAAASATEGKRDRGYALMVRGSSTVIAVNADGSGYHTDARGFILRRWDSSGSITFTSPHLASSSSYDTLETLAANVSPSMVALPSSASAGVTSTGSLPGVAPASTASSAAKGGTRAFLKVRAGESAAQTLMRPAEEVLLAQAGQDAASASQSDAARRTSRLLRAACTSSSLDAARAALQHVASYAPRRRARSAVDLGARTALLSTTATQAPAAALPAAEQPRLKAADFAAAATASAEKRLLAPKAGQAASSALAALPSLLASVRRIPRAAFGGWLEIPRTSAADERVEIESGYGGGYQCLASAARELAFATPPVGSTAKPAAIERGAASSSYPASSLVVDQEALRYAMLKDVFAAEADNSGEGPDSRSSTLLIAASRNRRLQSFFTADAAAYVLGRHLGVVLSLRDSTPQAKVYIACRALRYEVAVPLSGAGGSSGGGASASASASASAASLPAGTTETAAPAAAGGAGGTPSATPRSGTTLTNPPKAQKLAGLALAALTSVKTKKTTTSASIESSSATDASSAASPK